MALSHPLMSYQLQLELSSAGAIKAPNAGEPA